MFGKIFWPLKYFCKIAAPKYDGEKKTAKYADWLLLRISWENKWQTGVFEGCEV